MEKATERKSSRQNQIIDAAFSIAATNLGWSLSEVAAKIGVSKTALYRHFRNRAEIEEAMNRQMCREVAAMLNSAEPTARGIRHAAVKFLRENQGYLFLLMQNLFIREGFSKEFVEYLRRESPPVSAFFEAFDSLPAEARTLREISLTKNIVSTLIASLRVDGIEAMQNEVLEVLASGFEKLPQPDEKRLDELEAISEIGSDELHGGNRLLDAIAASIREYGILKTTIETIAEKMGTAKSSLYFYGSNKDGMLDDLVTNETKAILSLCADRAAKGKTIAEQIFVLMMVQANYLIMKPDILPVFNWIRYETIRISPKAIPNHQDLVSYLEPYRLNEIYPEPGKDRARGAAVLKWASILSTSCIISGVTQELNDKTMRKNIRVMFKSMMAGDKTLKEIE